MSCEMTIHEAGRHIGPRITCPEFGPYMFYARRDSPELSSGPLLMMPLCTCISIDVAALGLICSVEVAILHIIDIEFLPRTRFFHLKKPQRKLDTLLA